MEDESKELSYKEKVEKGMAKYSSRAEEVRAVVSQLQADQAWDVMQARDLDPRIAEYVAEKLHEGWSAGEVAKSLGLTAGRSSKEWRKIQAYFRQGFRGDAEVYLIQQTHKYYKTIERFKEIVEDAMENGTEKVLVVSHGKDQPDSIEHVKCKDASDLSKLMKAYGDAIALPVRLWKDFGAIGEKKEVGPQSTTIVVQNMIPMATADEIRAHQQEMIQKSKALEVSHKSITPTEDSPDEVQS